jgi:hypothetical protein
MVSFTTSFALNIRQKFGWAPDSVWALWGGETIYPLRGIVVTTLTELPWLYISVQVPESGLSNPERAPERLYGSWIPFWRSALKVYKIHKRVGFHIYCCFCKKVYIPYDTTIIRCGLSVRRSPVFLWYNTIDSFEGEMSYLRYTLIYCVMLFEPENGGDMFFETSVDLQRTTQPYIREDRTPHNHRSENLKF